jgi:diguanylate cyclase (GGDEF)-like protein
MFSAIHQNLDHQTWQMRALLACLFTLILAMLDLWSGPDLSFALFYLLPIGILAWYNSQRQALLLTIGITANWIADGILGGLDPIIAIWNALLRGGFFVVVITLLVQLQQAYVEQQRLAQHDPLTGLVNMRALQQYFTTLPTTDNHLTVAGLDLDNFKQVNDRLGHSSGDAALQMVADTMRSNIRGHDLCARIGGDEFVILLANCDAATAGHVLTRIQATIRQKSDAEGWGISASIGAISMPMAVVGGNLDHLLQLADKAMYRAKSDGKDQVIVDNWTASMEKPHHPVPETVA